MATRTRRAATARAAAVVAALLAGLAFTACSGSSKPSTASTTTTSIPIADGTPTSAPSSSSKTVSGANKKACDEVNSVKGLNNDFNAVGSDLGKGKKLIHDLEKQTDALAKDAPSDLASDASTFRDVVHRLAAAVDKAKSVQDLQSAASSDPDLKGAVADLITVGGRIIAWSATNC